ncbi:MAG: glycine cleavage system protein H [Rhodospirillaceae bacterium]|nr:glycine cleavage system protein H [Rhodospirillaceae bacterium]|tara:strand:+ start:483 stop:857 length:375 start_codon:yes stop_codon:yes gene_type:complete
MKGTKYTKEHEWIRFDDDYAFVGITEFAQKQLGDVVFVQLPEVGSEFKVGDEAAVIESVKAASEVYAPVSGKILDTNSELIEKPEIINSDSENEGWIWKMSIENFKQTDDLMDKSKYLDFISEE